MACHNKFKAEILSGTNILLEPLQLPSKTHKSWWPLHSKVYFKGVNNPIFLPMKASMTWSYLCSAPGPFHGETIYILSSMESQAKNLFCDVEKKGNMLLCPKTGAFLCRKTKHWSCNGNMLKDTCFIEGAVCERHRVSAMLQQPCVHARKVTRPHRSPWTPSRAAMWYRM